MTSSVVRNLTSLILEIHLVAYVNCHVDVLHNLQPIPDTAGAILRTIVTEIIMVEATRLTLYREEAAARGEERFEDVSLESESLSDLSRDTIVPAKPKVSRQNHTIVAVKMSS